MKMVEQTELRDRAREDREEPAPGTAPGADPSAQGQYEAPPDRSTPAARNGGVRHHSFWIRLVLIVLVLAAGVAGKNLLAKLRREPPHLPPKEMVVNATGIQTARQDVQTILNGFGTTRAAQRIDLSPEVGGRVIEVNPELEVGNVINEGELLFQIDMRDYEYAAEAAEAEVERLEAELSRLDQEEKNDERRLEVARQSLEIAQRAFDRIQTLVDSSGVESQSRLDLTETEVRRAEDQVIALENQLALYDARRKQLQAQLRSSRARAEDARIDLERTTVKAPATVRVAQKMVEYGQVVNRGQTVLQLVDDSTLEIPVSLEGGDVGRWLDVRPDPRDRHWFEASVSKPVKIHWAERLDDAGYLGRVIRVESYEPETRTFILVVEVERNSAGASSFPLAEGMFCELEVPGKMLEGVIPIPREAVDSEGRVLVSEEGRLRTRHVEVLRYQDDIAIVGEGLEEGDIVLTSRPRQVIENARVEVSLLNKPGPGVVETE